LWRKGTCQAEGGEYEVVGLWVGVCMRLYGDHWLQGLVKHGAGLVAKGHLQGCVWASVAGCVWVGGCEGGLRVKAPHSPCFAQHAQHARAARTQSMQHSKRRTEQHAGGTARPALTLPRSVSLCRCPTVTSTLLQQHTGQAGWQGGAEGRRAVSFGIIGAKVNLAAAH